MLHSSPVKSNFLYLWPVCCRDTYICRFVYAYMLFDGVLGFYAYADTTLCAHVWRANLHQMAMG